MYPAAVADLDGDGDLDVIACAYFLDTIIWIENQGGVFGLARNITTTANGAYYVYGADIDGDGDQNVVGASALAGRVTWYRNDGSGNFVSFDIDVAAPGARMVQVADLDNDGDQDVVAASVDNNTVSWHENDGTGNFVNHIVDAGARGAYCVWTADVDGDAMVDVVAGSRDDYNVAVHHQVRIHIGTVAALGDTLRIGPALLLGEDPDNGVAGVTYVLTAPPSAGALELAGTPLGLGDTFGQRDINNGLLQYIHDGIATGTPSFGFALQDSVPGLLRQNALFRIRVGGGLMAHWPLDESAGTVAADLIGHHDGTLMGNPVWQTAGGVVGGCLGLDGSGDGINLGPLDITGGEGLTLMAWIRPDPHTGTKRLISKATGIAEQAHYWMVSTFGNQQVRFRLRTNNLTTTLIAPQPVLVPGQWHHVACSYDGLEMKIVVDGVLLATQAKAGPVDTNPSVGAAIGIQPPGAGADGLPGLIDDVRIYNRGLTVSQIAAVMTGLGRGGGRSPHCEPGTGLVLAAG